MRMRKIILVSVATGYVLAFGQEVVTTGLTVERMGVRNEGLHSLREDQVN